MSRGVRLVHVLRRQAPSCIARDRADMLSYIAAIALCVLATSACAWDVLLRDCLDTPGPASRVWRQAPHELHTAMWCATQVTPEWERLTAHIEADPESKEKLGCVQACIGSGSPCCCVLRHSQAVQRFKQYHTPGCSYMHTGPTQPRPAP